MLVGAKRSGKWRKLRYYAQINNKSNKELQFRDHQSIPSLRLPATVLTDSKFAGTTMAALWNQKAHDMFHEFIERFTENEC